MANLNIFKRFYSLCLWASNPLVYSFYQNILIKDTEWVQSFRNVFVSIKNIPKGGPQLIVKKEALLIYWLYFIKKSNIPRIEVSVVAWTPCSKFRVWIGLCLNSFSFFFWYFCWTKFEDFGVKLVWSSILFNEFSFSFTIHYSTLNAFLFFYALNIWLILALVFCNFFKSYILNITATAMPKNVLQLYN